MSTHETDHRANEGEIKEVHRDVAEEYRAICDERCVGSRLVGIMDPTLVREALADLTTVSIEVDGATVPGFVDIAYSEGAGYVPERCRRITGDAQGALLYYAAPPLTSAEVTRTPTFDLPESGHIFFDHNSSDTLTLDNIQQLLQQSGYTFEELPLEDEVAAPDNKQASISLYGVSMPWADYSKRPSLEAIMQEYQTGDYAKDGDGARLLQGNTLSVDDTEVFWELYQNRFQWLGENHPLLMEDCKEEFLSTLTRDNTLISAYYENNEPTGFAFFSDQAESWLSERFMQNPEKVGLKHDEPILFWTGIVAKPESTGQARPILQLVTKVLKAKKASYRILFENTNRSELYVPSMTKQYVDELLAGEDELDMPVPIDRQMYRCIKFIKLPA